MGTAGGLESEHKTEYGSNIHIPTEQCSEEETTLQENTSVEEVAEKRAMGRKLR